MRAQWETGENMLDGKTLFIAGLAFIVPLSVVAVMNREMISQTYTEQMTPDPTVGKVMYFYSPG